MNKVKHFIAPWSLTSAHVEPFVRLSAVQTCTAANSWYLYGTDVRVSFPCRVLKS